MDPGQALRASLAVGHDGSARPVYLGPADAGWLAALVGLYEGAIGRRRGDLDLRAGQREPVGLGSRARWHWARLVLDEIHGTRLQARIAPARVRQVLFETAARLRQDPLGAARPRDQLVAQAAAALGLPPADLEAGLFADLAAERVVGEPGTAVGLDELVLRANLALVRAVLRHTDAVEIAAVGGARGLVRHARLRGLICNVTPGQPAVQAQADAGAIDQRSWEGDARLHLSGPLALFRRTTLYGRALAELAGLLGSCRQFRMAARCLALPSPVWVVVQTGDPLGGSLAPIGFDSRLEARLARDLARAAPDWELLREPEPIRAGSSLIFPDFRLRHRRQPERTFWLEIVGFWTPDYLAKKLAGLRAAGLTNLILCIDADRNCSEQELPRLARVVSFRRRLDLAAVLAAVEDPGA